MSCKRLILLFPIYFQELNIKKQRLINQALVLQHKTQRSFTLDKKKSKRRERRRLVSTTVLSGAQLGERW